MNEAFDGRDNREASIAETSGGGAESMGSWLDEHEQTVRQWRRGDVVDGVVVSADREEFLVDIGSKSEAIVPPGEVGHGLESDAPKVGESVLAYVISGEDQEGRVVLSLTRARAERGWRDLQKQFEAGASVEGEVVDINKGGLVVNVEGVRGFVPLSQIADLRRGSPDEPVEARLEVMKGRTLLLKVIEMNRRRNRLILSERAALQERRSREKERLLAELEPGETRAGVVSSICDFGAFVDLGGADGLVHLSELSWGQVSHPSQVTRVGERVKVYVVGVDRDSKKIALSMKRLQAEPWAQVAEKYQPGQIVNGKITKLAAFGAFAEIEPGIEGLIHISELSEDRITHPKQVVREGDELPLKIIRIESDRHRLGLSLRQAEEEQGYEGGSYSTGPEAAVIGEVGYAMEADDLAAEANRPAVLEVAPTTEFASAAAAEFDPAPVSGMGADGPAIDEQVVGGAQNGGASNGEAAGDESPRAATVAEG